MRVFLSYLALAIAFQAGPDSATIAQARRIAASAQLAEQEYRLGVVDGRVVQAAEVDEARLFLTEARRNTNALPEELGATVAVELDRALQFVAAVGAPDSVAAAVARLSRALSEGLGVSLVEIPTRTPSLSLGAEIYARECAGCHGELGRGDGPAGRGLDPAPADLSDHEALFDVTPLAFYQRITIGVAGTAMPAYESTLSAADRWAVALYASTLRQATPRGEVPVALRSFANVAEQNDEQILVALGPSATREQLAAVRFWQDSTSDVAAVFATVRDKVAESARLAREGGGDAAVTSAFDAYLAFEEVERSVHTRDAALVTQLEAGFSDLRSAAASGSAEEIAAAELQLYALLERAERLLGDRMSATNLFAQSVVLILREGIEAILIIGALLAFLSRVGAANRRRDVHLGVGVAVGLSLVTAVLLETVFLLSPAQQEVLEGITMLVAVGVLFYVSYWLLSKIEVQKWTTFVRNQVNHAVSGGSAFALASAAFLAVYREGFETVLFYKALLVSGGEGSALPVSAGLLIGIVGLAGIYVAINRYGVRLPLRPFFAVTSAFLYYTAFVFAGKGIAELQAGGVVGTTYLSGWPRLPVIGVYPTLETVLAQGVLVLLAVAALVVTFVRRRRSDGDDPEPVMATAARGR
jgi:high-affinity iron transporter